MKTRIYDGAICGKPGSYGIVFPEFMGCISAGDTLDKVSAMGHEALQFHIEGMLEDGEPVPEPRRYTIEQVAADMDDDPDDPLDETWVAIVPVTVNVAEPQDDVALELPPSLARDVDEFAADRRRFIIDATRRELLRLKLADRKDAA